MATSKISTAAPSAGVTCIVFAGMPLATFSGPTFTIPPLTFTNPIVTGAVADMRIEDRDLDGVTELYIDVSQHSVADAPMIIDLPPYPDGHLPSVVIIELQAGNDVATIEALDRAGLVVATNTVATSARTAAIVAAAEIEKVRVLAVETAVFRICWY